MKKMVRIAPLCWVAPTDVVAVTWERYSADKSCPEVYMRNGNTHCATDYSVSMEMMPGCEDFDEAYSSYYSVPLEKAQGMCSELLSDLAMS